MQPIPPTPSLAGHDGLDGHLWILEAVTGAPVRFAVTDAGLVFGDEEREFEPWAEPLPFRAAARHVRERFDDAAFRAEVESPTEYTFVGVATRFDGIDYDWERLPPFLGVDIRRPDGELLPPDAVERAYDRLGVTPVNAVEKEVPAKHFSPERYGVPNSVWYDGPAAGLLVRTKTGDRACVPGASPDPPELAADPDAFARDVATARLDSVLASFDSPTVEAVLDRLLERLAREEYARLFDSGPAFDVNAFRSALAETVSRRLSP